MKLELRNIKVHGKLSQETLCYSATVHVDGKPAVDVTNRGHGGCDEQHLRQGVAVTIEQLNAHMAETQSPLDRARYGMKPVPCDLERWCHREVTDSQNRKDFQRTLKRKICFVENNAVAGVSYKGTRTLEPRHFAHFAEKNPGIVTLNSIPFEEAWAIAKPLIVPAA